MTLIDVAENTSWVELWGQRELLHEGPHLLLVAMRHGSSISLLHNIHNLVNRA